MWEDQVTQGLCSLPPEIITKCTVRYDALIKESFELNPAAEKSPIKKRGRTKQSDTYNLLRWLKDCKTEVLRYTTDFDVPFDNNQSERVIRMMKVKQKVSGCFRSTDGLKDFCRIRSCILTLRKQESPILVALKHVFDNTFNYSFQPA